MTSKSETNIPEIVPGNEKHYAYIDSRELDKYRGKSPEPITVRIFGGSLNGQIVIDKPEGHRLFLESMGIKKVTIHGHRVEILPNRRRRQKLGMKTGHFTKSKRRKGNINKFE